MKANQNTNRVRRGKESLSKRKERVMHVWTARRVTTRRWPDEHAGEVRAVVESVRAKLREGRPMHEALPAGERLVGAVRA